MCVGNSHVASISSSGYPSLMVPAGLGGAAGRCHTHHTHTHLPSQGRRTEVLVWAAKPRETAQTSATQQKQNMLAPASASAFRSGIPLGQDSREEVTGEAGSPELFGTANSQPVTYGTSLSLCVTLSAVEQGSRAVVDSEPGRGLKSLRAWLREGMPSQQR